MLTVKEHIDIDDIKICQITWKGYIKVSYEP